jgi:hypothetical protein
MAGKKVGRPPDLKGPFGKWPDIMRLIIIRTDAFVRIDKRK